MESEQLLSALANTFHPETAIRQAAEQSLQQVELVEGFGPVLMEVTASDYAHAAARQAGAIYLKNFVLKYWRGARRTVVPEFPHIPANDKATMRAKIVHAVARSPELCRVQLLRVVKKIAEEDYPDEYSELVNLICQELQNGPAALYSSLLCYYQLVKVYEFKEKHQPLWDTLDIMAPILLQIFLNLLPSSTMEDTLSKKVLLKIFFSCCQYELPVQFTNPQFFSAWMDCMLKELDSPVPADVEAGCAGDTEALLRLPHQKTKKWVTCIIERIFERYGHEGLCEEKYKRFAVPFTQHFSGSIVDVYFRLLSLPSSGKFLSPRVVQKMLKYFTNAITHPIPWKLISPHLTLIIDQVLWPLLWFSNEDAVTWEEDPAEYIRKKYDLEREFADPVVAAQNLIAELATKRAKRTLDHFITTATLALQNNAALPADQRNPREVDGALNLIGVLSEFLLKKKNLTSMIEPMLVHYVFPETSSPYGFLRSRACWHFQRFSSLTFADENNFRRMIQILVDRALHDSELPVRVDAYQSLSLYLRDHTSGYDAQNPLTREILFPVLETIITDLLKLCAEVEVDELPDVLQTLLAVYADDLGPMLFHICNSLVQMFMQILEGGLNAEDDPEGTKSMLAGGMLSSLDAVIRHTTPSRELFAQLETILLPVFQIVFTGEDTDFMEDLLNFLDMIVGELPEGPNNVSEGLWTVFQQLVNFLMRSDAAMTYFPEIEPVLELFVQRGGDVIRHDVRYIDSLYHMCEKVFRWQESGDDSKCRVGMFIEELFFTVKSDGVVREYFPKFIQLVIEAALGSDEASEGHRDWCLQVLIDALYADPLLTMQVLDNLHLSHNQTPASVLFLTESFQKIERFAVLRDKKMVVLALTSMMNVPFSSFPASFQSAWPHALNVIVQMFKGIEELCELRSKALKELDLMSRENGQGGVSSEGIRDAPEGYEDLDDEELFDDAKNRDYISYLTEQIKGADPGDEDDDDDDDLEELVENTLPDIDEYVEFSNAFQRLQRSDAASYNTLVQHVDAQGWETINKLLSEAVHRTQVKEAERVAQDGGFQFNAGQPATFAFGNGANPFLKQ